jgi:RNA polymerase sigma-70 factor (ECF subfamily)
VAQRKVAQSAPGDEADLVLGARSNPARFSTLYERYQGRIYAYLRSRTSGEEDAADLTQHVFVLALDALPRYRAQQVTFGAWLFRIARNVAVDFHRRHRATVPWDFVPEALQPAAREDLATTIIEQEYLAHLGELFIMLNAESRELLTLRFVGQLTAPEIAVVIGASEAATRKRLSRILRRLKERLDEPTY